MPLELFTATDLANFVRFSNLKSFSNRSASSILAEFAKKGDVAQVGFIAFETETKTILYARTQEYPTKMSTASYEWLWEINAHPVLDLMAAELLQP